MLYLRPALLNPRVTPAVLTRASPPAPLRAAVRASAQKLTFRRFSQLIDKPRQPEIGIPPSHLGLSCSSPQVRSGDLDTTVEVVPRDTLNGCKRRQSKEKSLRIIVGYDHEAAAIRQAPG